MKKRVKCTYHKMLKNNSKGIIYGDHSFSFPAHMNYGAFILEKISNYGNKLAMVNGVNDEKITYAEITRQSLSTAMSLTERGLLQGDCIAIVSENRSEFLTTCIAAIYAGGIVTFINSLYNKGEILHAINIAKPKYVFLSPNAFKNHFQTFKSQESVSKIFLFGDTLAKDCISYNDLANKYTDTKSYRPVDYYGKAETALILYSSGTTGLPKGAKITHANLMASALKPDPCLRLAVLTVAPWVTTMGFVNMITSLVNKKLFVYMPKFELRKYLETIQNYKIGMTLIAPPIVVLLNKTPEVNNYDISSLEIIHCGGAPLDESVIRQIKSRLPNLRHVLQGYGMTEATGAVTEERETVCKQGSTGKVVQGNIIKVVDIESRKILGPRQPGEVCVKGVVLFDGYVGKTKSDDFDEDGFYKTGDIAYYDEDGFFYIVDRIKELIKYKGWQVSPAELEALLLEHPAVKDVGVTSLPDPVSGELPIAFVVKQPGENVTEKEIIEFVHSKVSSWKRLRGGVRFTNEIPKNGSGKILRRLLREMLKTQSKL